MWGAVVLITSAVRRMRISLKRAETYGAVLCEAGFQLFHQPGDMGEVCLDGIPAEPAFVDVGVQDAGDGERSTYVFVAGLCDESFDYLEQLAMAVVGPAAGVGDGLDGLRGRAPALLGGLQQITSLEFGAGLGD